MNLVFATLVYVLGVSIMVGVMIDIFTGRKERAVKVLIASMVIMWILFEILEK
jgi:hypothetical protein